MKGAVHLDEMLCGFQGCALQAFHPGECCQVQPRCGGTLHVGVNGYDPAAVFSSPSIEPEVSTSLGIGAKVKPRTDRETLCGFMDCTMQVWHAGMCQIATPKGRRGLRAATIGTSPVRSVSTLEAKPRGRIDSGTLCKRRLPAR